MFYAFQKMIDLDKLKFALSLSYKIWLSKTPYETYMIVFIESLKSSELNIVGF